ncbi:Maf family protein [Collinsella sp. An2]|uniref:Maf family protein n=1 Tax=Collinsella sp. An2 TaxID=1965585 RepID=UPI000B3A400D|nr:Maf family protein [Collinsella sp. An2]OUP08630.1 septum formation protein Maf [Collinsella sp. An2]
MILASQSPRRVELMREAGYDFQTIPADIDETALPDEGPAELVGRLSRLKAHAVASAHAQPGELVVAADTVVAIDGAILGKPLDANDACHMLRRLSGRTHQVMTGAYVMRCEPEYAAQETDSSDEADGTSIGFVEVTDVTFYPLSDDEIERYVASGEPLDKAGSYGIQGTGGRMLVRKIDGDFYNVVGLPIARVARAIDQLTAGSTHA